MAGNVVPDEVALPSTTASRPTARRPQAETHLRESCAPWVEDGDLVEVVDVADGAAPSLDHPLLAALIARNDLTVRAKLGWTDVARFAAHGIPAANFGPGDATLAHTADERVAREPIERTYAADSATGATVLRRRASARCSTGGPRAGTVTTWPTYVRHRTPSAPAGGWPGAA